MPDFSQFIKYFNTALPAPTSNNVGGIANHAGTAGTASTTSTGPAGSPAGAAASGAGAGAGDSSSGGASSGAAGGLTSGEMSTFVRLSDATWRLVLPSDAAVKESGRSAGGGGGSASAASANAGVSSPLSFAASHPSITVGRMMVSTEDRWRIQAQMRREEAKSGQQRKEYNRKVTRAIKITKGPSGEGFPAGRGRPV